MILDVDKASSFFSGFFEVNSGSQTFVACAAEAGNTAKKKEKMSEASAGSQVEERKPTGEQLKGGDAQHVDIAFGGEVLFGNDLRRNVPWIARSCNKRRAYADRRVPEVAHYAEGRTVRSNTADEDVFRLQVSVENKLPVAVGHGTHDLLHSSCQGHDCCTIPEGRTKNHLTSTWLYMRYGVAHPQVVVSCGRLCPSCWGNALQAEKGINQNRPLQTRNSAGLLQPVADRTHADAR